MKPARLLSLLMCLVLVSCTASLGEPLFPRATATDAPIPSVEQIVATYKTWTRLNEEPRVVPPGLYGLCRMPTELEQALMGSPHAQYAVNLYVNEIGYQEMIQGGAFPIGSAIVKEKFIGDVETGVDALGIMIKARSTGDPAGGDWDYVYWDGPDTVARGPDQTQHCQACHVEQGWHYSVFYQHPLGVPR